MCFYLIKSRGLCQMRRDTYMTAAEIKVERNRQATQWMLALRGGGLIVFIGMLFAFGFGIGIELLCLLINLIF